MIPDLLVCGSGPAGRALAHRALAHGLTVTVVDPHPARRWTATYAAWADELPAWLAPDTIAATVPRPAAWGTRRFEIDRVYVVFAVAALQDSLDITGATVIADRVEQIHRRPRIRLPLTPRRSHRTDAALAPEAVRSPNECEVVRLSGGTVLRARHVIDARGLPRSAGYAEQTAYGVVLQRDRWDEATFMDWRRDNGATADAPASFLYAVPLGADTILMEETCLAGRPALPIAELRDRLRRRLHARGIELDGTEPVERVRFPLEGGRPGHGRFGAAGGFLHPATGYSVAAALAATDAVIASISGGTADILLPLSAHTVHRLRTAGLHALLALPPADLPAFFDAFFELAPVHQRAYLSGRDDLPGTAAAMTTLFRALPWRMRRVLAMRMKPV